MTRRTNRGDRQVAIDQPQTERARRSRLRRRLAVGLVLGLVASAGALFAGPAAEAGSTWCNYSQPRVSTTSTSWRHLTGYTTYSSTNNRGSYRGTFEKQYKRYTRNTTVHCYNSPVGVLPSPVVSTRSWREVGNEYRSRTCHWSWEPARSHPQSRTSCSNWAYGGLIHWGRA